MLVCKSRMCGLQNDIHIYITNNFVYLANKDEVTKRKGRSQFMDFGFGKIGDNINMPLSSLLLTNFKLGPTRPNHGVNPELGIHLDIK
jgi:hypothetical protein